ncbi:MAG TPA: methyltransferase domain-containing protein [Acidimicrobiales bacterium]|nr:methyltransferase domain-containing protein [Acidimicrobiales bacterium]
MDLAERAGSTRRHPWETERASFLRRLIDHHLDGRTPRRVLDVGAGDGWFAEELQGETATGSQVVCWDVNYAGADLRTDLPAGVARTVEEPGGSFDLVLLLDVLEHVEDDARFLDGSVLPHLAPDGLLVVTVPAYQRLYSSHDRALGHHRRYSPARLRALLEPRVDVVARGGLFAALLPVRAAQLARERVAGAPDRHGIGGWTGGPGLTRALSTALGADARAGAWLARRGLAVPGLSTWAVCRPLAVGSPGSRP